MIILTDLEKKKDDIQYSFMIKPLSRLEGNILNMTQET